MSARSENLLDRLTRDLESHAESVASRAGQEIFGDDGGGDAQRLTRQKYLDYLRRNWNAGPDGGVEFRTHLWQRVGDEEFLKQAFAVFLPDETPGAFMKAARSGLAEGFEYPGGGDNG